MSAERLFPRASRSAIGGARAPVRTLAGLLMMLLCSVGTSPLTGQEAPDSTRAGNGDASNRSSPERSSELVGQVASRQTGEPIAGAQISIPELNVGTVSDPEGEFRIPALPAGEHSVRVQYLGFITNRRPLRLEPEHVTRAVFLLERDVLRVAELEVIVKRRESADAGSSFRRRMERRRFGEFITREDIGKENPQHMSDMLRDLPGVKVTPVEAGQASVFMRGSNGSLCEPTVFLDGLPARGFEVDNLQPAAVEGMEVYRRPSEVPAEFKGAGPSGCGVLVIWSQTGRISSVR